MKGATKEQRKESLFEEQLDYMTYNVNTSKT